MTVPAMLAKHNRKMTATNASGKIPLAQKGRSNGEAEVKRVKPVLSYPHNTAGDDPEHNQQGQGQ